MVATSATAILSDIDLSSSFLAHTGLSNFKCRPVDDRVVADQHRFLTACIHQAVSEADRRAGLAVGKNKMFETK
jgi:hypothetical protein